MTVPSLKSMKGGTIQAVVEDIHRLVDEGRISETELEARLTPQDLRILAAKINPFGWYPIDSYERMVELLASKEAGGRREAYLVNRGAKAAERLKASGVYQQLSASADDWGPRVGKLMVSIQSALLNFTKWTFENLGADHSFRLIATEAAEFPEAARYAAQGFIEYIANQTAPVELRITSERETPDRIVYLARPVE